MRVVITGAGRGIGRALADRYRADGHEVIGTARDGTGDAVLDVTDPDSQRALTQQFVAQPVDLLVCNAGVYLDKGQSLATGFAPDLWEKSFAVNVTGVFLTVQALLENLKLAQRPRIAIIASQMGSQERANGGSYIYRASKAAAINLGRNLAKDLRTDGIAVGVYHPGWVQTDMGGASADIGATEATGGLIRRFEALSLDTTGCFETWDGRAHPL